MTSQRKAKKWKPARERINPVTVRLRFDDDDGDDAGAAFAFANYLDHYRAGDMAEALQDLAELHRLVGSLLLGHAWEANEYAGLTWAEIGRATGTSGQAAWEKWHRRGSADPLAAIRRREARETREAGGPQILN